MRKTLKVSKIKFIDFQRYLNSTKLEEINIQIKLQQLKFFLSL